MTTQQPEALRLADICAKKGLFAVEDELRRLHAESELHLQELRSYRITVENREARIAELEKKLGAQPSDKDLRDKVARALGCGTGTNYAWSYLLKQIESLVECEEELIAMKQSTHPTQKWLDAQNPQNAVLDLSARPTVQIHWAREGDPNVFLHSVSVDMDGSCTTAGVLEAVAAAINDYAKQARKKYGGGIPWDTMNLVNVRMHSRDADGYGASIDGHSVIVMPNKQPHGVTIIHPTALAAQAEQGGASNG